MTVKCIKPLDKTYIVHSFVHENTSINTLANLYGRSRRTIIRVLEENGVEPGIKRRPRFVVIDNLSKLVKETGPVHQIVMFEPKKPWYLKALSAVARALSPN